MGLVPFAEAELLKLGLFPAEAVEQARLHRHCAGLKNSL